MKIVFASLSLALLATACNNEANELKKQTDRYEQTKLSLEEMEKQSPAKFLSVTESDKKNLLGQRVVKGKITNNARMASFKDVEIKVAFYSKTGVLLEEDVETIYETLAPGATASFKSKYFAAKGTDSVVLKVVSAKAADKN